MVRVVCMACISQGHTMIQLQKYRFIPEITSSVTSYSLQSILNPAEPRLGDCAAP